MPPAEGERIAIGGYGEQYRASAYLILHALQKQTLERIRLADPAAGRVDDFQLERAGQIDAYQFKWSRYRGKFSLADLQATGESGPPLIQQLADGSARLRSLCPNKRVIVHLASNDLASDTDTKAGRSSSGRKLHFAAFLEEVWKPVQEGSRVIPADWGDVWESLRGLTGLSASDFLDFVECCRLDLGWTDPAQDSRPSLQRLDTIEEDIRNYRAIVHDRCVKPASYRLIGKRPFGTSWLARTIGALECSLFSGPSDWLLRDNGYGIGTARSR